MDDYCISDLIDVGIKAPGCFFLASFLAAASRSKSQEKFSSGTKYFFTTGTYGISTLTSGYLVSSFSAIFNEGSGLT